MTSLAYRPRRIASITGEFHHRFHGDGEFGAFCASGSPDDVRAFVALCPLPCRTKYLDDSGLVSVATSDANHEAFLAWIDASFVRAEPLCRLYDCRHGPRRHAIDALAHSIDLSPTVELQWEVEPIDKTAPLPFTGEVRS